MKKIFFMILSSVLLQCTTHAMEKKLGQKKTLWGQWFGGASSSDAPEVPVERIQLMNEQIENLPNLYVSSLAQLLDKNPKEFLDLPIQLPMGTIREYIAHQESKDTYFRMSKEEHHVRINEYISRTFFENDENVTIAVTKLHQDKLTTMNFRLLRDFLRNVEKEKTWNEQKNFERKCWKFFPTCLLGLNVTIVVGLGAFLLRKEENKSLGYTMLGVGLSGSLILLPKLYKQCVTLRFSSKKLREYCTNLQFLNDEQDESTEIRYVSN